MLIYLKYISPVFSKHLFFSNFVILLRAKHKTTKELQKYVRTYFLPSSNLLASWRNESNYKHVINIWESKGRMQAITFGRQHQERNQVRNAYEKAFKEQIECPQVERGQIGRKVKVRRPKEAILNKATQNVEPFQTSTQESEEKILLRVELCRWPLEIHVQVLNPNTCECDPTQIQGLCRCDQLR